MPYYKKHILHWYHGVFKATPANNLYIAYLMLTKLQVLNFLSFILTILILKGRRKNLKAFNEASGVMQISFSYFGPTDLFLFTLLGFHIHLYTDYSIYFNKSQPETQWRKRSDVTKTSVSNKNHYPLKISHAQKDQSVRENDIRTTKLWLIRWEWKH